MERKDELENNRPASTGDKWKAYEKLKPLLRKPLFDVREENLSRKEADVNVAIARDILVPLGGHCVLNSRHLRAYRGQVDKCQKREAECSSCASLSVAGSEEGNRLIRIYKGFLLVSVNVTGPATPLPIILLSHQYGKNHSLNFSRSPLSSNHRSNQFNSHNARLTPVSGDRTDSVSF